VSEQRFRELVDLLPQTVCEIDLAGNFTFKNRHGFEIYGYTQEDVDKGLNTLQLFIPEDRDRVNENIQRILSGEKLGGNEYTALRKDGSRFPVIMYCSPIIYKNKPIGLRGIVVDITERKRSEKSLNEYRKQIQRSERLAATGRLAASIAHEINNPLQAVSANLGFLVHALPDNFKENNSIEQIKISINRIKNIVKQLLDIHHPKIKTEQKVDVNEVIESTLNLLKNQLMIGKIKVNKNLSANIPLTRGIAQELIQVFVWTGFAVTLKRSGKTITILAGAFALTGSSVGLTQKDGDYTIPRPVETAHKELSKPSSVHTELTKPTDTHTELSKPTTVHTELMKPTTPHKEK